MTQISLIAIIWIWTCAVYGQIPVNEFDPYHSYYVPYASSIVNMVTNAALAMKADQTDLVQTKKDVVNLKKRTKPRQLSFCILDSKASQADLDNTNGEVSRLRDALTETNGNLEATQADLETAKNDILRLF